MAFQENTAGDFGFGPVSSRASSRAEPYSLGAIKDSAINAAQRLLRSVETWISGSNDDVISDMSLQFGSRGLAPEASSFGTTGGDPFQSEVPAPAVDRSPQPTVFQVEGGDLRLAGDPRGLPFRHPLDAPSAALTGTRPLRTDTSQGVPLLRPLDEVLQQYVQDRTGGSEGMHVFNFNAKERLDFEAKIGRDLARLARSSRPSRSSVFDVTSAPKPALDVWSSGPPRGFSLGGVVAPPELPPASSKRRKVPAPSLRRVEEKSVVEVAESVPPVESDVEVVEPTKSSKPASKPAPKRPKKAVEPGEEITKVTTDEDFWKVQIEAIYRRRNPHKLADVPAMLEKHKGNEKSLYRKVCQRYDLDSKKLYSDPKNWESEDKDVKDDDEDVAPVSSAPSSSGFAPSSAAPANIFGSGFAPSEAQSSASLFGSTMASTGASSLFGQASSGSALLFDIPPPSDPDKKINIFASSTQAEKRFATADSVTSGGLFGQAASSGGLFGATTTPSIFGATSASSGSLFGTGSAKVDEPKSKAESVPTVEPDVEVQPTKSSKPSAPKPPEKLPEKPPEKPPEKVPEKAPEKEPTDAEPKEEIVKVTTDEDFWKVQIEAIYRRRNPHKLKDVPGMLEKHKGKEIVLYCKVCQRYDLDSKKFYADPKNWESEDKDVKDDDDDVAPSSAPSSSGFAASSAAPANIFGSGASLFSKEASSGSLFDLPPSDEKKINIFATQAEKPIPDSGGGLFGQAASSGGLFGATTTPSIFGGTSASSGSLFGTGSAKVDEPKSKAEEPAKPTFPPQPGPGTEKEAGSSLNLFGGASSSGSSSIFAFGSTPASGSDAGSLFGSGKNSGGNLFGGSGGAGNLFGTTTPPSIFESSSSSGNLFAAESKKAEAPAFPPQPLFGGSAEKAPTFGLGGSSSGSTGANAESSGSIFGGSESGPLFGSGTGSGNIFAGSTSSSTGSIFGASTPNIFGASTSASTGSIFGFGSTAASTGGGNFGADAGFGRQISALSDPFGLEAQSSKRRAGAASPEEKDEEPLGADFGSRRKADPEVLAKRKMLRGRRSASAKPPEPAPVAAPTAEFPPKPPLNLFDAGGPDTSKASDIFKGGNIFAAGGGGGSLFGSTGAATGETGSLFGSGAASPSTTGSIFGGSTGGNLFGGSDSGSLFGGSGNTGGNIFAFGAGGASEGNKKKRRAE